MRIWILGLGLRLCLTQSVEMRPVCPSTAGNVARFRIARAPSSTVLNGLTPARRTMLVHVSCGVKTGDRDAGTLEHSPEIDRKHDLGQLALTIGSGPAVAAGQHYVAEVDRLLSGRRDV